MKPEVKQRLLAHLDRVLQERRNLQPQASRDGTRHFGSGDSHAVITLARAAVEHIAGKDSVYARQLEAALTMRAFEETRLDMVMGVVIALRKDVDADALQSIAELIHGELFSDFLEMARHLIEEGYKDPSAVIAGSSLEAHIRQLCEKNGINTELTTSTGNRPKKADQMNGELGNASIYSKLDQKTLQLGSICGTRQHTASMLSIQKIKSRL
jgi:hypothetical protein